MGTERMIADANASGASASADWLRALALTKPIVKQTNRTLPTIIDELAATMGEAPALLGDGEYFTFRTLADRANRYARWALAQDLPGRGVVCLLMPNRPEYMAIWLGITRVGGVVALLNTGLAGASLAHCIDIVGAQHIIVAHELSATFAGAKAHLTTDPRIWMHGGHEHEHASIERILEELPGDRLHDAENRCPSIWDRALLIYTSGTTGAPKAANVSHYRLLTWSLWFAGMMNTQSSDRMYNCLPMYHSIGGVVATGAALVNGGSVLIRDKFSAHRFWDDVARWDCTLFQYIGELCRYLVLAAPHPRERAHRLRLCCGNGLRPDVWGEFQTRFRIPRILEFYAATEGNVTLFNCEGRPGAIGRIPSFLAHRSPTALVKCDLGNGNVVRNERGHCVRCLPGEVGEAIGRISDGSCSAGGRFERYTSEPDSERRILRDVFEIGDAWFRTGDLMRQDERDFFYFIDRVGDNFRWKGENVSATEVAEAINAFSGVSEAAVYGVQIPGTEGRAGMAAVVVDGSLELAAFRRHLAARLPAYARPVFLRIVRRIESTMTFKQRKVDLARDAYDPRNVKDAIYFNDVEQDAYVKLDEALFERIQARQLRV